MKIKKVFYCFSRVPYENIRIGFGFFYSATQYEEEGEKKCRTYLPWNQENYYYKTEKKSLESFGLETIRRWQHTVFVHWTTELDCGFFFNFTLAFRINHKCCGRTKHIQINIWWWYGCREEEEEEEKKFNWIKTKNFYSLGKCTLPWSDWTEQKHLYVPKIKQIKKNFLFQLSNIHCNWPDW